MTKPKYQIGDRTMLAILSLDAWNLCISCDSNEKTKLWQQFISNYGIEAFCLHLDRKTLSEEHMVYSYPEKLSYLALLMGNPTKFK